MKNTQSSYNFVVYHIDSSGTVVLENYNSLTLSNVFVSGAFKFFKVDSTHIIYCRYVYDNEYDGVPKLYMRMLDVASNGTVTARTEQNITGITISNINKATGIFYDALYDTETGRFLMFWLPYTGTTYPTFLVMFGVNFSSQTPLSVITEVSTYAQYNSQYGKLYKLTSTQIIVAGSLYSGSQETYSVCISSIEYSSTTLTVRRSLTFPTQTVDGVQMLYSMFYGILFNGTSECLIVMGGSTSSTGNGSTCFGKFIDIDGYVINESASPNILINCGAVLHDPYNTTIDGGIDFSINMNNATGTIYGVFGAATISFATHSVSQYDDSLRRIFYPQIYTTLTKFDTVSHLVYDTSGNAIITSLLGANSSWNLYVYEFYHDGLKAIPKRLQVSEMAYDSQFTGVLTSTTKMAIPAQYIRQ